MLGHSPIAISFPLSLDSSVRIPSLPCLFPYADAYHRSLNASSSKDLVCFHHSSFPASPATRYVRVLREFSMNSHFLPLPNQKSPSKEVKRGRSSSRTRNIPHCFDMECPIVPSSHTFDSIPWIAAMDATPDDDVMECADLSLLDIANASPLPSSPGPGPVRTRRSSLRARSPASSQRFCDTPPYQRPRCTSSSFLHRLQQGDTPATPVKQHRRPASPVRFHHLMPALPVYDNSP